MNILACLADLRDTLPQINKSSVTETMPLIVHHLHVSQSERVPWLCEELGIDYELKTYDRAPMLAPPEYKALHPTGAAPVIQDGDLTLAESGACLEYIAHRYGAGRFFLKPSDPEYADFLYWWHWANASFQMSVNRMMLIAASGLPDDHFSVKLGKMRMKSYLEMLDSRVGSSQYLAGDHFTAADIMLMFSLTTMRYWSQYSLAGYEGILGYLKRLSQRPAYRRALEKSDPGMQLVLGADSPKPYGK